MKIYRVDSDFLRGLLEAHKAFCACKIRELVTNGTVIQEITIEQSDDMTDEFMDILTETIPDDMTVEEGE